MLWCFCLYKVYRLTISKKYNYLAVLNTSVSLKKNQNLFNDIQQQKNLLKTHKPLYKTRDKRHSLLRFPRNSTPIIN